jgi:hypothetical protein
MRRLLWETWKSGALLWRYLDDTEATFVFLETLGLSERGRGLRSQRVAAAITNKPLMAWPEHASHWDRELNHGAG